jgi:hypothetical protein
VTPLSALLQAATVTQRLRLSALSGISINYLYQIAGCHRPAPSVQHAFEIEHASRVLQQEVPHLPIVTARDIATMCAIEAFGE